MNVLHISTFTSGGAGLATLRLHEALLGNNINSRILSAFPKHESPEIFTAQPVRRSIIDRALIRLKLQKTSYSENKRLTDGFPTELYEMLSFPRTEYRLHDEPVFREADIIHLHWVGYGFLDYPSFFAQCDKPIVWTLHDMNPILGIFHYEGERDRSAAEFRQLDERIAADKRGYLQSFNGSLHVAVLNEWMKEVSGKSKIFGKYPHYVIPNGIRTNYVRDEDHLQRLKKTLGFKPDRPSFMLIAEDVRNHRKGFDLAQEAIGSINHDINLILVGKGEMNFSKNVNRLEMGRVSNRESLMDLYSMADMVVIPSREDNLPNVMLEAFSVGTPVTSFAVGGMKDHISDYVTGFLAKSPTAKSLADELNRFCKMEHSFNRESIVEYARSNFSYRRQAELYEEIYSKALSYDKLENSNRLIDQI